MIRSPGDELTFLGCGFRPTVEDVSRVLRRNLAPNVPGNIPSSTALEEAALHELDVQLSGLQHEMDVRRRSLRLLGQAKGISKTTSGITRKRAEDEIEFENVRLEVLRGSEDVMRKERVEEVRRTRREWMEKMEKLSAVMKQEMMDVEDNIHHQDSQKKIPNLGTRVEEAFDTFKPWSQKKQEDQIVRPERRPEVETQQARLEKFAEGLRRGDERVTKEASGKLKRY